MEIEFQSIDVFVKTTAKAVEGMTSLVFTIGLKEIILQGASNWAQSSNIKVTSNAQILISNENFEHRKFKGKSISEVY